MNAIINGFGRIGRLVFRSYFDQYVANANEKFKIVAINDLSDMKTCLHLLQYDSVHGRFDRDVKIISEDSFSVDGEIFKYFSHRDPSELRLLENGIDFVLECSGVFNSSEKCQKHLNAGAKKVLISAPAEDADFTIVYGINNQELDYKNHRIISNASCTTNCFAPVVKVLNSSVGIVCGSVTTVHSYTADQKIVDSAHKDLRRARAGAVNMVPTSTGAAKAIEKIFPSLSGKLLGLAVRVPTPNVSLIDFSFVAARSTSVQEINDAFKYAAQNEYKGILSTTEDPCVSSDFNHSTYSSIVDLSFTKVVNNTFCHCLAWYDNEFGFASRMIDVAKLLSI